jgi:hypothetical protein
MLIHIPEYTHVFLVALAFQLDNPCSFAIQFTPSYWRCLRNMLESALSMMLSMLQNCLPSHASGPCFYVGNLDLRKDSTTPSPFAVFLGSITYKETGHCWLTSKLQGVALVAHHPGT